MNCVTAPAQNASPAAPRSGLRSLQSLLEEIAPDTVPGDVAVELLGGVAAALGTVHATGAGVGLGPETITFGNDGVISLAGGASETTAFLAPERRAGGAPTPASDAYAFAVIAERLLADELPSGFPVPAAVALARCLSADPAGRPAPGVLHLLLADALTAAGG